MKITLVLFAAILAAIAAVTIVGYILPVRHKASRSATLRVAPEAVWHAISDFKGSISWRRLKSVEQIEVKPGVFAWKEVSANGDALTYLTLEASPEEKLIRKIVDENLPFGGTWTFELQSKNGETTLTITEDGEVYNPIFRFVSRYIFGHHASLDKYVGQLKKHLGEV